MLTLVAMLSDWGPAPQWSLAVYVYWRMHWLQLTEDGSRIWREQVINIVVL